MALTFGRIKNVSALQKCKAKRLDRVFVMSPHSVLVGKCREEKTPTLNFSKKYMKTTPSNHEYRAFTHLRILAAVLLVLTAAALVFLAVSPPAVAQRDRAPAAANSKILQSRGF